MNIRVPRLGLIPEVHHEVMHACMHTHDLQTSGPLRLCSTLLGSFIGVLAC
jgi:hypothetical protein